MIGFNKQTSIKTKQIKSFITPNNHRQQYTLRETTDGELDDPLKVS